MQTDTPNHQSINRQSANGSLAAMGNPAADIEWPGQKALKCDGLQRKEVFAAVIG